MPNARSVKACLFGLILAAQASVTLAQTPAETPPAAPAPTAPRCGSPACRTCACSPGSCRQIERHGSVERHRWQHYFRQEARRKAMISIIT